MSVLFWDMFVRGLAVIVAFTFGLIGVYLVTYFAARGWYMGRLTGIERYYRQHRGHTIVPVIGGINNNEDSEQV